MLTFPNACRLVFHATLMISIHRDYANLTARLEMQNHLRKIPIVGIHFVISACNQTTIIYKSISKMIVKYNISLRECKAVADPDQEFRG